MTELKTEKRATLILALQGKAFTTAELTNPHHIDSVRQCQDKVQNFPLNQYISEDHDRTLRKYAGVCF